MLRFKKPVLVQIEANIAWLVVRDPGDGHWFGVCPALNLNAIGRTWSEFQQCANETIALLFQDLFKSDELEQFLRSNGWRAETPIPPRGTPARFEVPFTIERKSRFEELAAAPARA